MIGDPSAADRKLWEDVIREADSQLTGVIGEELSAVALTTKLILTEQHNAANQGDPDLTGAVVVELDNRNTLASFVGRTDQNTTEAGDQHNPADVGGPVGMPGVVTVSELYLAWTSGVTAIVNHRPFSLVRAIRLIGASSRRTPDIALGLVKQVHDGGNDENLVREGINRKRVGILNGQHITYLLLIAAGYFGEDEVAVVHGASIAAMFPYFTTLTVAERQAFKVPVSTYATATSEAAHALSVSYRERATRSDDTTSRPKGVTRTCLLAFLADGGSLTPRSSCSAALNTKVYREVCTGLTQTFIGRWLRECGKIANQSPAVWSGYLKHRWGKPVYTHLTYDDRVFVCPDAVPDMVRSSPAYDDDTHDVFLQGLVDKKVVVSNTSCTVAIAYATALSSARARNAAAVRDLTPAVIAAIAVVAPFAPASSRSSTPPELLALFKQLLESPGENAAAVVNALEESLAASNHAASDLLTADNSNPLGWSTGSLTFPTIQGQWTPRAAARVLFNSVVTAAVAACMDLNKKPAGKQAEADPLVLDWDTAFWSTVTTAARLVDAAAINLTRFWLFLRRHDLKRSKAAVSRWYKSAVSWYDHAIEGQPGEKRDNIFELPRLELPANFAYGDCLPWMCTAIAPRLPSDHDFSEYDVDPTDRAPAWTTRLDAALGVHALAFAMFGLGLLLPTTGDDDTFVTFANYGRPMLEAALAAGATKAAVADAAASRLTVQHNLLRNIVLQGARPRSGDGRQEALLNINADAVGCHEGPCPTTNGSDAECIVPLFCDGLVANLGHVTASALFAGDYHPPQKYINFLLGRTGPLPPKHWDPAGRDAVAANFIPLPEEAFAVASLVAAADDEPEDDDSDGYTAAADAVKAAKAAKSSKASKARRRRSPSPNLEDQPASASATDDDLAILSGEQQYCYHFNTLAEGLPLHSRVRVNNTVYKVVEVVNPSSDIQPKCGTIHYVMNRNPAVVAPKLHLLPRPDYDSPASNRDDEEEINLDNYSEDDYDEEEEEEEEEEDEEEEEEEEEDDGKKRRVVSRHKRRRRPKRQVLLQSPPAKSPKRGKLTPASAAANARVRQAATTVNTATKRRAAEKAAQVQAMKAAAKATAADERQKRPKAVAFSARSLQSAAQQEMRVVARVRATAKKKKVKAKKAGEKEERDREQRRAALVRKAKRNRPPSPKLRLPSPPPVDPHANFLAMAARHQKLPDVPSVGQ